MDQLIDKKALAEIMDLIAAHPLCSKKHKIDKVADRVLLVHEGGGVCMEMSEEDFDAICKWKETTCPK